MRELVSTLLIRHEIDDSDALVPFKHGYGEVVQNMVLLDPASSITEHFCTILNAVKQALK